MKEQIQLAIKNISKRKKRAALTVLGIFIGIAAVVALVSLGEGLEKTVQKQFEKVGADKILIQPKEFGFGSESAPGRLEKEDVDSVKKAKGVSSAAGMLFQSAIARYNNIQRTVFLASVPEDPQERDLAVEVNTWEAERGRLLTHKDEEKAVVGYNLAHSKIFGKNLRVGNKMLVGNKTFKIVGILKRTGDPGLDRSITVSEKDAREVLETKNEYSIIMAQSERGEDPEKVAESILKKLRKKRGQREGKEDFTVQTSTELIQTFLSVLSIIKAVFIGIAAISLIVGGVGIMNTMFTSVLERTREIGVMKAIGAKNSDVMKLFLTESAVLGFLGGLLGITAGAGISKTIETAVNYAMGGGTITTEFSTALVVGVLAFASISGMIAGALPAKRASKLRPVDALREE